MFLCPFHPINCPVHMKKKTWRPYTKPLQQNVQTARYHVFFSEQPCIFSPVLLFIPEKSCRRPELFCSCDSPLLKKRAFFALVFCSLEPIGHENDPASTLGTIKLSLLLHDVCRNIPLNSLSPSLFLRHRQHIFCSNDSAPTENIGAHISFILLLSEVFLLFLSHTGS